MAQAIRIGYRIDLPHLRSEEDAVSLFTLKGALIDQIGEVQPRDLTDAVAALLKDRPASGDLDHGRWGWKPGYGSPGVCRYCCSGGPDGDHRRTVCRACGMPQCLYPRDCRICLAGYLDGVSYGLYGDDRQCGYKHCTAEAVAKAPHVKRVCGDHIGRPVRQWDGERLHLIDEITAQVALLGQTYGVLDWQRTYWFPDGA
ncbi:hypothetical protein [Nonomuraea rubra]|uniref:hypothetical protein n=1 Tax=Nonomuraea rubra TaxID=46180 RepID=UPI0033E2B221